MKSSSLFRLLVVAFAIVANVANADQDPVVCIDDGSFTPPPQAPAPQLIGQLLGLNLYVGATPPDFDPARPMLVMFQGITGTADSWWTETNYWGRNDMYDAAYARGYQTFFLDHFGSAGTDLTPIEHGLVLSVQLQVLAAYLGVERFNVIAHSKGGPDTNFAAVFGAPVDSIVTLSGAHHGSPLADLAQVSFFDWLTDLLGVNSPGLKFLQTGCMAIWRPLLDSHPSNANFSYFTTAGTAIGPFPSALWLAGFYLAVPGVCPGDAGSDGLVCVEHARHPLSRDASGDVTGEHRVVWDSSGDFGLDHDNIRMGNAPVEFLFGGDCHVPVFDSIEPYISSFRGASASAVATPGQRARAPESARPASQILRGGPIAAGVTEARFPVEDGVRRMEVRVMVASPEVVVSLVDPSGNPVAVGAPEASDSPVFRGAFEAAASLVAPAAGPWTLRFGSKEADAFAAVVGIDGVLDLRIDAPSTQLVAPGQPMSFRVTGGGKSLRTRASIGRTSTVSVSGARASRTLTGAGEHALTFDAPGVHSVALVSEGTTAAGMPFERTKVLSVAVVDPAARSALDLPAACQ